MPAKITYQAGFNQPGTRLTYVEELPKGDGVRKDRWACICGNIVVLGFDNVRSGGTRSCGCLQRESATTHGCASHSDKHWLYERWNAMKKRCYYPKHPKYSSYGGKGIVVCRRWLYFVEYKTWIETQGMTTEDDFEVHRKDATKNYGPNNCICLPREEHRALEAERSRRVQYS